MSPEDRIRKLGSAEITGPSEAEWQAFSETAHRSVSRRRLAAVAGGTAFLLIVFGGTYAVTRSPDVGPDRPEIVGSPTPTEATDAPPTPSDPVEPVDPVDREAPLPLNQWYFESDGTLKPFVYFEYKPATPRKLLEQTIAHIPGPLGETGGTTAIPEDNRLAYLQVRDGKTAEVVVRGQRPSDDENLHKAQAQIVYTLTQFDGIERVNLTWEGRKSEGLTRADFHDLLGPIVLEEPYAVQEVGRAFRLKGIANVYEATVSWRLTGEDGEVFKEGFTTATCGSGCWGTFEDRITLERVPSTRIVLQVFQESAEDGSPMDLVEVPLKVQLGTD